MPRRSANRGRIPSVSVSGMFFRTWRFTIARASVNPPRTNADDTTVSGSRAVTMTASRSTATSTPSIILLRSSIVVRDRAGDAAGASGPAQQRLERHAKPDQRVDPQRREPMHLRVVLVREVLDAGPDINSLYEGEALEEPVGPACVHHGIAAVPQIRVIGDGLELLAHP